MIMKIGDVVAIYEDPKTKLHLEGKAVITTISMHDISDPKMIGYSCDVQFIGEDENYRRFIYE